MISTRKNYEIYLIGHKDIEPLLRYNQIPTLRQVLQRFHFYLSENKSIRNSSHLVIDEVYLLWSRADIPTTLKRNGIEKLEKKHSNWLLIKKNKNRSSEAQKIRENNFIQDLDTLFDVAHDNALSIIKYQEDRDFLNDQRNQRKMVMTTVDKKLEKKLERTAKRKKGEETRRQKAAENIASTSSAVFEFSSGEYSENSSISDVDEEYKPTQQRKKNDAEINKDKIKPTPNCKNVFNLHVTSALDRNKVSDREALRLIVPLASALGHDPSDISISRSTIQRRRKMARKELNCLIQNTFSPNYPLVVHWDGKMLPNIVGTGKIDRLPVLVSGDGEEKLLGVPMLAAGTGKNAADEIYELLAKWNVLNKVRAFSFDTTSVNTGHLNGVCVLLEKKIGREVLWLACRHHIMELILAKVFKLCFGPSNSPEIPIFKRFKSVWDKIDQNLYQGLDLKNETHNFNSTNFKNILSKKLCIRDDYQELVELTLIVLNQPPATIHWRAPGPIHHARWMAKLIYAIKIFLFRSQRKVFNLTKKEESQLQRFVLFGALIYTKIWIESPLAAEAPMNDLNLWLNLKKYEVIDFELCTAARQVLERHLWYLSDELVGLALFSDVVTSSEKKKIVDGMKTEPEPRHIRGNPVLLGNKVNLGDFASKRTLELLKNLEINCSFLNLPPEQWSTSKDWKDGTERIKKLRVVNDTAERGVKLIEEFNNLITNDETEKQFLLQVVEANRKCIPTETTKRSITQAITEKKMF